MVKGKGKETKEMQRPNREQAPPPPASPWLVLLQEKEKKKQNNGSSFGWVLLMEKYDPKQECLTGKEGYYLWNPETLESIPLPPLQLKPGELIIGMQLTSPPENTDSGFVMYVYEPWGIFVCLLSGGDRKWVRTDCSKEIKDLCNGKLTKPTRLSEPGKDHTRCKEKYVASCGDVLCIQLEPGIGDGDIDTTILKLDLSDYKLKETKSFPWLTGISQRLSLRLNHG